MLTGFNTDFKYKGTVYHVQTEDNGLGNPVIVTLLYQGGAILASRKTSYADILKFEKLESVVKELMESQHKQIIKDLISGKFTAPGTAAKATPESPKADEEVPLEAAVVDVESEDESFGADLISSRSLDEVILDYLSGDDD
jgi:ketol-acid reductoisomerase